MSRPQHDYDTLRREYISSDISVRELARTHNIKSWSTINARKKSEDWDQKRSDFKAQASNREVTTLVTERLRTISDIHEELLFAIRSGVRAYIASVNPKEGAGQQVTARDLMGLIDKFLLLSGSTPHRTENRSLESHSFSFDGILEGAPDGLLRELAELAESNGAGGQPMGRGPLVVLEGTRAS